MERSEIFDADLLQQLMEREKLDLLLVSSRHNVRYLTGGYFYPLFLWDTHTRETQYLPFIGIERSSIERTFFAGRPGERAVAEEEGIWIEDIIESKAISTIESARTAAQLVRKRGHGGARIGVELSSLPADAFAMLKDELPQAEFFSSTALLDSLRAVKNEREIGILRRGALLNLEGVNKAIRGAVPGMSTLTVAERTAAEFGERGLHYFYALVCAGPFYYRAASGRRFLSKGRIVHIDAGALSEGYIAETCRTGSVGPPSPEALEMIEQCYNLEQHMLPHLMPGASASDIQREAYSYLKKRHPSADAQFIAHGIGMVHHEKPVVSLSSREILAAGMVISLEMEFRSRETGHVKIEEMAVIRSGGCEILTPGGGSLTAAGTDA